MASILFLNIWLLMNDISVNISVFSSKYKCSPNEPSVCCGSHHNSGITSSSSFIDVSQWMLYRRRRSALQIEVVMKLFMERSSKTGDKEDKFLIHESISEQGCKGSKTKLESQEFGYFVSERLSDSRLDAKASEFAYRNFMSTIYERYTILLRTFKINRLEPLKHMWKIPKTTFSKSCITYYPNSTATRQILLIRSGDVEVNPGWQSTFNQDSDYLQEFAREIQSGSNKFSVAQINIRSLRNKIGELRVLLQVCRFDILAITETHLDRKLSNNQIGIENYKIFRRDRSTGAAGGGCLVYVIKNIGCSRLKSLEAPEVEGIWLKLTVDSSAFITGIFYRPPSDCEFFDRFNVMLERVWMKHRNVLLV